MVPVMFNHSYQKARILTLFRAFVCLFITVVNGYAGVPIKIMPLGDSITQGLGSGINEVSYRQQLFLSLVEAGYDVDFVGSRKKGSFATPYFDADNEGHPGWTASQVASNVYDWLVQNNADVVLLHVGTNWGYCALRCGDYSKRDR